MVEQPALAVEGIIAAALPVIAFRREQFAHMDRVGGEQFGGAVLGGATDPHAAVVVETGCGKEFRRAFVQPARHGDRRRCHQEVMGIFVEQHDRGKMRIAALVADVLHEGAAAPGARDVEAGDIAATFACQFADVVLAADHEDRHPVRRAGLFRIETQHIDHRRMIAFQVLGEAADVAFLVVGKDDEMVALGLVPLRPCGLGREKREGCCEHAENHRLH